MKKALSLAHQAARKDEVPVGAVIVQNGKQIATGFNLREKKQDPTAHAEILAITRAAKKLKSWRLVGCTLYVTLEPCPMCLAAAQQARISKIIYGTRDPKGGALCLGYKLNEDTRTHHRFDVELQYTPECSTILSEFFRAKRQK